MSYILFGFAALGGIYVYKKYLNENINFTMTALKAQTLLKESKLYKSLVNLYNKRESIIVLSLEYKINDELFLIGNKFTYSVKEIKNKINKSYDINYGIENGGLNDLVLDIKWKQYDKIYRTRVKYMDLDKLELPNLTDKLYKDFILTGFTTIEKDGKKITTDVTELLNQYSGPYGDFFKNNEIVLNKPETLFTQRGIESKLYYMDYKGNEFSS